MQGQAAVATFVFTDIEGSTRLWELEPERMRLALARHDGAARDVVARHRGEVVKMTGDGVHAVFRDPADAVAASLQLQLACSQPGADGLALRIRCGMHLGEVEVRDNDYYGSTVNRAARIMGAAHGGQVLLSEAVARRVLDRLPEGVVLLDLGAVRLRDLSQPVRVHQVVHPLLRQDFPALRSLEATPNNLPQQLNSFVAREGELAHAKRLLADSRLLTLLGMGGLGKSRLSVQLAADVLDDFPDGVWLVELAPVGDGGLVPQAVASVLGVREEAGRSPTESLAVHVGDRRLLLLLDNCEHLLAACATLAKQLLQAGAQVKILATSREYLQIAGEATYHVPTLDVPAAGTVDPDQLVRNASVQLFLDRACAARSNFQLTAANARPIGEICRRLDGIALAIELAAARVRFMPVEAIAARLDDRFRLLTTRDRTVLPRQQTLRALVDWSFELLSPPERRLFAQLSVFAGGWTLAAAEAVGTVDPGDDILDLLGRLVEKSLVMLAPDGDRYGMLETVRSYARERLEETGEAAIVQERHLDHYLVLAEDACGRVFGDQQAEMLARIDLERENMISAIAGTNGSTDDGTKTSRLVYQLRPYWILRGLLAVGLRVTVEVLRRPGLQGRGDARRRTLFAAGQLCSYMGQYEDARPYLSECLAIAREQGNLFVVAMALQTLGVACMFAGERETARGHLREAVDLNRRQGFGGELVSAVNSLAHLYRLEGDTAAGPLYDEAVALARARGDVENVAIGLLNLAMLSLLGLGEAGNARERLLEVLSIAQKSGSRPVGISVLDVCAGLASLTGAFARAARYVGVVERELKVTGLKRDPTDGACLLPLIERARNALDAAAFERAVDEGRTVSLEGALADARNWLDRDAPRAPV